MTGTGSGVSTVVSSPTESPACSAVARSITTSPSACGARPAASVSQLSSGSAIQLAAMVGGPSPPTVWPSAPISWAVPRTSGTAAATPSTAATSATVDSSIRPRIRLSSLPMRVALRTTTSVPSLAAVNVSRKPASVVAPRIIVAARKATPRTTATLVLASRRLRLHKVLKMVRNMGQPNAFIRSRMRWGDGDAIESTMRPSARKMTVSA